MNKLGFTLIELLVVIGIISTLLLVGVGALISYYRIQTFNVGVADVVTTLQTAKSYAQSQVKKQCTSQFYGYGVSVNSPSYTLNEICVDSSLTPTPMPVETKTLHKDLTLTPNTSVIFRALTGSAEPSGTVTSFIIKGYSRCQTVNVNTAGNIYTGPAIAC